MSKADALVARLNELAVILLGYGIDPEAIVDAIQWIQEHEGADA